MLLGFISLLLTATSSVISNICIPSRFYDSAFAPCTRADVDEELEETENYTSQERKLLTTFLSPHSFRRLLNVLNQNTCKEARHFFIWILIISYWWSLVYYCVCHLYIFLCFCSSFWILPGSWAICIIWRPWTTAPIHLCDGSYSCILQLLNNAAGNCQGYTLFSYSICILIPLLEGRIPRLWWFVLLTIWRLNGQIHSWRVWEDEAHRDLDGSLSGKARTGIWQIHVIAISLSLSLPHLLSSKLFTLTFFII